MRLAPAHALLVALLSIWLTTSAWGADSDGVFADLGSPECGGYLDAYAGAELIGGHGYSGKYAAWGIFGFINGSLNCAPF